MQSFELQAELAGWFLFFFFHGTAFLLEKTADQLWLFQLGYLVDIFLKIN